MNNGNLKQSVNENDFLDVVYAIVRKIKQNDYAFAFDMFKQHHLSFFQIVSKTQRLKTQELSKFADFVIAHKFD